MSRQKGTVWQWSVGTRCTISVAIEGSSTSYITMVGLLRRT